MKTVLLLFLLLPMTSLIAQEEGVTAPKIAMKIALGEVIETNGMTIEFVEVLEDSRCPADVVCVWAGQAKVKVKISDSNKLSEELDIIVGKQGEDVLFVDKAIELKGISLTPYPTTENMGKRDYCLLVVKREL